MRRLPLAFALGGALGLTSITSDTLAQNQLPIPHQMINPQHRPANELRFCLNTASMLVDVDRQAAQSIADALLLTATFYDVRYAGATWPHDYEWPLAEDELALVLLNQCDALMGFPLPLEGQIPDWLTVSRPYYSSSFVFAAPDSLVNGWSDLQASAVVGSRIGGSEIFPLRVLLSSMSMSWRPHASNDSLYSALIGAQVDAIVIWEPALTALMAPEHRLKVEEAPFRLNHQDFAVALPSNHMWLRSQIDDAIAILLETGQITALYAR